MITNEELAAIDARLVAATPGNWIDMGEPYNCIVAATDTSITPICRDPEMDDRPEDRAFIVHAPDDIGHLLAEVARLTLKYETPPTGTLLDGDCDWCIANRAQIVRERDEARAEVERLTTRERDLSLWTIRANTAERERNEWRELAMDRRRERNDARALLREALDDADLSVGLITRINAHLGEAP